MEDLKFWKIGDIKICDEGYLAYHNETPISLTKTEFRILQLLAKTPNYTFSRSIIHKKIWGGFRQDEDRTIDVHIHKLRKKLNGKYIKTMRPIGYKFEI